MFLEAGRIRTEESVKVYLIRADLPLGLVTGGVIEYL